MKNKILLSSLIGILIIVIIGSVSAGFYGGYKGSSSSSSSSIYDLRYQGDPGEPSTSYYSGYWNSGSSSSSSSGTNSVKTFNGPYTQAHVIKTTYPKTDSIPSSSSNYFRGGDGYNYGYSSGYSGYGYYGGYGYYSYPLIL